LTLDDDRLKGTRTVLPADPPNRRAFLRNTLTAGASAVLVPGLLSAGRATEVADESPWQIGCFTRPWDQYEYRVALDAIAEAGFKHAGLMTAKTEKGNLVISTATTLEEARQIGAELRKRGLECPCVYGGGFPVQKSLAAGIAGLRRLIDNAAAAGAATLMAGGIGNSQLYDDYYKAIAECCDYAAERHVGIVLKPHGGLNATGPQCRKSIERVGHRNFALWYDPGNIFYYSDGKLDPVDDAPSVAGLVSGMCVKDFTMSVSDGKVSKDVLLAPGTGKVDFPAVMAALRRGGFVRGPLVIETLARGDRAEVLEAAKRARRFVQELVD
jgi:sugar phosphate isomerase/epimerase